MTGGARALSKRKRRHRPYISRESVFLPINERSPLAGFPEMGERTLDSRYGQCPSGRVLVSLPVGEHVVEDGAFGSSVLRIPRALARVSWLVQEHEPSNVASDERAQCSPVGPVLPDLAVVGRRRHLPNVSRSHSAATPLGCTSAAASIIGAPCSLSDRAGRGAFGGRVLGAGRPSVLSASLSSTTNAREITRRRQSPSRHRAHERPGPRQAQRTPQRNPQLLLPTGRVTLSSCWPTSGT